MSTPSSAHSTAGGPLALGSGRSTGEIRKLTSLLEVSQALANATNFKASLHKVLEILEKSHDAVRSAVAIESGDRLPLEVVASFGGGRDKATAVPGASIARQVFANGRPVVIPRMSREP